MTLLVRLTEDVFVVVVNSIRKCGIVIGCLHYLGIDR